MNLKRCPCGKYPKGMLIMPSADGYKWAYAAPSCCNNWEVEFRTNGHKISSDECEELGGIEWNAAPRFFD